MTATAANVDQLAALTDLAADPRVRDDLIEAQLIGRGTTPEQTAERLIIVAGVLQRAGITFGQE